MSASVPTPAAKPSHWGPFRMPGSPWTSYLVLTYIGLVAVLLAITPDQRVAIAAGAIWALLLGAGWWRMTQREASRQRSER